MPVMRRLFAVNLLVALLGPWIAALSGTAAPVVPCPMHRGGTAAHATHTMAAGHQDARGQRGRSDHGTTARGCNCAGECGRSGATFSLAAAELFAMVRDSKPPTIVAPEQFELGTVAHFLPLATGPPQRLRI
jgi:hypothetical protein